jgi:hypothetical protein
VRLTILFLGVIAGRSSLLLAQTQPDRVWLAGRYDGNRLVVYLQFDGTVPHDAEKLCLSDGSRFFLSGQTSSELNCALSKSAE